MAQLGSRLARIETLLENLQPADGHSSAELEASGPIKEQVTEND